MSIERPEAQLRRARAMRGTMTKAEAILWNNVRGGQLGVKVRRQAPIGPYTADLACLAARLLIELDGPPHDTLEQRDLERRYHDHRRDARMRERGWRVPRVPNDVVLGGGGMVLDPIGKATRPDPPSDLASRGHLLPPAGEGWVEAIDKGFSCP